MDKVINNLILAIVLVQATPTLAQKTNQAVYEDPFDIGAGGASLTRASKEGRIFANPALLPYGGKFHRWLGQTTTLLVNKDSADLAQEMIQSNGASEEETEEEQAGENTKFIDQAFKTPIRAGWGMALSWVTNNFGLSVFSRFEPEIEASQFGEFGSPTVTFKAESYHGVAFGLAARSPWRWLSFGLTGKYIYGSEPFLSVDITDQEQIAGFRDPGLIQDLTSHNIGVGVDAGMLMFFQGNWVDLSIAAKADDIGNTEFKGPGAAPTEFKQVVSAGTALTFHTGGDAIHLALDYRDIQNAYGEELFKRVYAGTKILIRSYVGLSAGYYHGYPTYGAEVDLLLMRVAATVYSREFGDHPGVDRREIYMGSLSFGF